MADDDEAPGAQSPEAGLMAHIDTALAPAFRRASDIGTASLSDLKSVLHAIRQAFAHHVYGVPPTPEPEPPTVDPTS